MAKTSKPKDIDITKSGPMTFRDLLTANLLLATELSPEFQEFVNNVGATYAPTSLYDARANSEQLVSSLLMNTATPWGESMFDEDTATEELFQHLGDVRAENQPWYSKVANGLTKGAILAGTTFLDGTLGLLFGTATAINEGRWSGLWDNDFSKAMQAINEASETALPNYYTELELNGPWYENIFTANFLGDKFIKNLGFTVGAFYSGGLVSGGIRGAGAMALTLARTAKAAKTIGGITKGTVATVGTITSAVNEGRIEALNNSKDWAETQYARIDELLLNDILAAQLEYEATKGHLSGSMETGFVDPAYEKYKARMEQLQLAAEISKAQINEDRLKMGNADLLMNLPILTASNIIQFGRMYANGFRTGRRANNILGNATEGYTAGTTRAAGIRKALLNPLSEGTEEISQSMASRISGNYYQTDVDNYYKAATDRESQLETLDWIKAFATGINETVNDGSAWEEFFIGSLTGAMGMPRFRGVRNQQGKLLSPVTLEGGILGELRENRELVAREQEIVNYMNSRVQSPEFMNYYRGLSRHNFYQHAMDLAVEDNDKFAFENADSQLFISDINMFDSAGKLEDLTALINEAYDTSDENLLSIVENTTSVLSALQQLDEILLQYDLAVLDRDELIEDGADPNAIQYFDNAINSLQAILDDPSSIRDKHIGPFVDTDGNPLYSTQQGKQQMIDKLTSKKDDMLGLIDDYVRAKIDLQSRLPESVSNEQLSELIYLQTQVNNWDKRSKSMASDIKVTVGTAVAAYKDILSSKELLGEETETEDIKRNIEFLEKLYQQKPEQLASILTNPKNRPIVDFMLASLSLNDSLSDESISIIRDLQKIGKAKELYLSRLKEYIENPSIQAQHLQLVRQQQEQDNRTRETVSLVDRISNSSVSEIVSAIDNGDLSLEDLESTFSELEDEQALEAKDKVEEARNIIDTDKRVRTEVNDMVLSGEISEQEASDVLNLLNLSRLVSETAQELIDTDTEAFNTPELIDIDEATTQAIELGDNTVEGADVRVLALREQRLDAAKNTVKKIGAKLLTQQEELAEVPRSDAPVAPVTTTAETGHDSVDKVEPVNTPKPELETKLDRINKLAESLGLPVEESTLSALDALLDCIDISKSRGMGKEDILKLLSGTKAYKDLGNEAARKGRDIDLAILQQLSGSLTETEPLAPATPAEVTPDTSATYEAQVDAENKRDASVFSTDASREESVREGVTEGVSKVDGQYRYWKPTTTQYKIHRGRGDDAPYWQSLPQSKDRDRYQAIHEFLVKSGAFDRVRNDQVKRGDEVHFGISKELTERTGVPIVLILNSNNEVIGDLPIPVDRTFGDYTGLSQFYQGATKWYQDNIDTLHQDSDIAVIPNYKSNVARNMVGKAPYTASEDRRTLNEISTVTRSDGSRDSQPFKLAIAVTDGANSRMLAEAGRSKSLGASQMERTIIAPLDAKAGLPYLLLPTSSKTRRYLPVPITMPRFSTNTSSSSLGKMVVAKLLELPSLPNDTDKIMKWINEMLELLVLPEIHINFSLPRLGLQGRSPQLFTVSVKRVGDNSNTVLFKGQQSDPNMVESILNNLISDGGIPFQVSRKYINDTINGQSYNSMIGELASTNLPIGANHTIDDWFTIDPIVDKKQVKAHSPKSTRVNPTLRQANVTRFTDTMGNSYYMTDSNELYKENPNGNDIELKGNLYNALKAYAYGLKIGESMTRLYKTPWGLYDPLTGKFISETVLRLAKAQAQLEQVLLPLASKIQFDLATHTYTVDGTPVDISVTQWVHRGDEIEPEQGELLGYLEIASVLGTNLDELARAYFAGSKPTLPKNITKEQANQVWGQLKLLREQLNQRFPNGWTAITDDNLLRVAGRIQDGDTVKTIAGTMDMLIIDDKGVLHIVDFKTKRVRDNGDTNLSESTMASYNQLVSLYADLFKAMHPEYNIGSNHLAVFNVSYARPKGSRRYEDGNVTYTSEDGIIKVDGELLTSHPSFNAGTYNGLYSASYSKQPIVELGLKPQEVKPVTVDRNTALADLKKKGLLNRKERVAYINKLSDENIVALSQMSKLKSRQLLEKLDAKVGATMTSEEVNLIYQLTAGSKPLNRVAIQEMETLKRWSREAEIARVLKMIPQLSEEGRVKLVDALIKIGSSSNPSYAYGQFQNGIITLSQFGRGTSYHEAFHFVTQSLLSPSELSQLYQDAKRHYDLSDSMQLEEALAEDFRRFMQRDEGIFGKIFNTLKHIIKTILGKETSINKLFMDIRRGRLASRQVQSSNGTFYRKNTYELLQDLQNLRKLWAISHSSQFTRLMREFNGRVNRNWDRAYQIVRDFGLQDVAYVFEGQYGAAKIGVISRKEFISRADILKQLIKDSYNSELSEDEILSNQALSEQEARDIEVYYDSKLEYGNLTLELIDYITERGLPISEYNSMTRAEKEVFFRCMY